jgi:hypothetical protein
MSKILIYANSKASSSAGSLVKTVPHYSISVIFYDLGVYTYLIAFLCQYVNSLMILYSRFTCFR